MIVSVLFIFQVFKYFFFDKFLASDYRLRRFLSSCVCQICYGCVYRLKSNRGRSMASQSVKFEFKPKVNGFQYGLKPQGLYKIRTAKIMHPCILETNNKIAWNLIDCNQTAYILEWHMLAQWLKLNMNFLTKMTGMHREGRKLKNYDWKAFII